jgi:osomolarity two-component system phosphorelay intermediate protein YPD1
MAPNDNQTNGGAGSGLEYGDLIDKETFQQILEMDEVDTHDFSQEIVFDFFLQADSTFKDIDDALAKKDLKRLSDLGHFLKGSSATLGFLKVQATCEKIQRYGKLEKLDGTPGLDSDVCLENIRQALQNVKKEIAEVKGMLRAFYGLDADDDEES